jgi:radical SAM superfamily enzyme YgiQ (UPF0313 family)
MKIDIIVVYIPRYNFGHEKNFVPPITGIHLAALTPPRHAVRVIHQQVDPIPYNTDADIIALSFFSGFAPEAYRVARIFQRKGKIVIAGGPHATFWPEEALKACDAVVIGEAESVWKQVIEDAEQGKLRQKYYGDPLPLSELPIPRYDLLPSSFFVPRVVQATRGCPFSCSFCTVKTINPGFRYRPIKEVIRDIAYDEFPHWWQRKVVWFWDDNLTADRMYVKDLLRAMIPLKRWWLTQASIDIVKDEELLDLMQQSGCIGIFLGIESFNQESLKDANKAHNKAHYYRECIEILHQRGICVMAGLISGFDHDTTASIVDMAHQLYAIGVDVPYLSILTPFKGTTLYDQFEAEGRMLPERGWEFYNGYNVAFRPRRMSPRGLLQAHRVMWKIAFSWTYSLKRIWRSLFRLRFGAFLMCLFMNAFYGLKAWRGNLPVNMSKRREYHREPLRPVHTQTALSSDGIPVKARV